MFTALPLNNASDALEAILSNSDPRVNSLEASRAFKRYLHERTYECSSFQRNTYFLDAKISTVKQMLRVYLFLVSLTVGRGNPLFHIQFCWKPRNHR